MLYRCLVKLAHHLSGVSLGDKQELTHRVVHDVDATLGGKEVIVDVETHRHRCKELAHSKQTGRLLQALRAAPWRENVLRRAMSV
jgi:hypothetical protein